MNHISSVHTTRTTKLTDVSQVLVDLYRVLQERKSADPAGSYTAALYAGGRDHILSKLHEELFELVLAAKNERPHAVIQEGADLLFHLLVLLAEMDMHPNDILEELVRRFGTGGITRKLHHRPERAHQRRTFRKQLLLHMQGGLVVRGYTQDVSLEGILIATDFEPKWQLLGEKGMFEIAAIPPVSGQTDRSQPRDTTLHLEFSVPEHIRQQGYGQAPVEQEYRFTFEVVRVTEDSIALQILDNHGLFGFALSHDLFHDMFAAADTPSV